MSDWTDTDSVTLSAALVAHDGHRMRLRGPERETAVRLMVDRGLDGRTMAHRLCLDYDAFRTWASRNGIRIPRPEHPEAWARAVLEPSARPSARKRQVTV